MVDLRPLRGKDLKMLFEWRNNDQIVSLSASQKKVTYSEHQEWFRNILTSDTRKIFIVEHKKLPIGQIRFDKQLESLDKCEISIYLLSKNQDKGLGSIALNEGIAKIFSVWPELKTIIARVRIDNVRSQFFFTRNKFLKGQTKGGFIFFKYLFEEEFLHLTKKNEKYYDTRVSKYGNSFKSLNWGSKESQNQRFKILTTIGDFDKKTILDFGCGIGDYYSWLIENNYHVNYTGIDISSKMIEQASKQFSTGSFHHQNIFIKPLENTYDYILLSGVFTYTDEQFFQKCISQLFKKCEIGLGFNLLSKWGTREESIEASEFVAEPTSIINFCNSLTKKVVFRHDYHERDFTVFLYK